MDSKNQCEHKFWFKCKCGRHVCAKCGQEYDAIIEDEERAAKNVKCPQCVLGPVMDIIRVCPTCGFEQKEKRNP